MMIFRHLLACAMFAVLVPCAVNAQTFTSERFHCRISIPSTSWYRDSDAERQMRKEYKFAWAFRSIDEQKVIVLGVIPIAGADTLDARVVDQFVGQAKWRGGIIMDTGYTTLGGKRAFQFMLTKAPVKKDPPTYNVITLMNGYGYQFMVLTADGSPIADEEVSGILNSFEFIATTKQQ